MKLIEPPPFLYSRVSICSDASQMAPAVRSAVLDIIAEKHDSSRELAEAYITRLQEQGRWATDVWF